MVDLMVVVVYQLVDLEDLVAVRDTPLVVLVVELLGKVLLEELVIVMKVAVVEELELKVVMLLLKLLEMVEMD